MMEKREIEVDQKGKGRKNYKIIQYINLIIFSMMKKESLDTSLNNKAITLVLIKGFLEKIFKQC